MGMPLTFFLIVILETVTALFILGCADATNHIIFSKEPPLSTARKGIGRLVAAPPEEAIDISSPLLYSPHKAPHLHHAIRPSSIALAPSASPFKSSTKKWVHGPASSQSVSFHKHHHSRKRFVDSAPKPSYPISLPKHSWQVSPFQSPFSSSDSWDSPAPSPAPAPTSNTLSSYFHMPVSAPAISPSDSFSRKMMTPPPEMIMALPSPPPNEECTSVTCSEPLMYTPPGLPCGCVWPIQVKLRLGIAINAFFPLVNELVEEIAASIALNHSQVRIMGANADRQQLEKSTALINLIPRAVKFNDTAAFSIYKKFWSQAVHIKPSLFGAYEVFYVQYPGLPPSPPSPHSSISSDYEGPDMDHNNNGRTVKPLAADVHTRKNDGHGGIAIAVITFSSLTALIICIAISWVLAIKCRSRVLPKGTFHASVLSPPKPSGSTQITKFGSKATSTFMPHRSGSLSLTYTGSAKTFTMNDIKRATDNFNASRIVGEGGFGLVYKGTLDNGTEVAVKVLKREDRRGGQEFFAEVEMLGRLHHRNLVRLIGICTEEHTHCLIYELIRNGSVASHLHGVDKETNPLNWDARMKIALGAARGLAYLHEDSSPRVIHRDFKSSNILLEYDFTPKVSDFGLARTALEEGDRQVSTHVMGTFGYLAPEYAMTGHLLVKSDVYSYGVVLLELLTGRKPVDLAQPLGQENLVAYARPLLTNKEGLETIVDPSIKSSVSFDNVAKVAAIASMCIQAEVSHRPFMGEVVQALKLVCSELDETKEAELRRCTKDSVLINVDSNRRTSLSASDFFSNSMGNEGEDNQSFTRHSTSGSLTTGRKRQLWQILTTFSSRSISDQLGYSLKSRHGKN